MTDRQDHAGRGIGRRRFIKLGGLFGLSAGFTQAAPAAAQDEPAQPDYPVKDIARLADLQSGAEVLFEYPDEESPAVLLRLDAAAEGGIGPNEGIVAFSLLCTHKGCPVQFKRERGMLICPCHWSSFDAAKGGRLIIGQATESLPQVTLRVQDGTVQATGVTGLIYGRYTNVL
jgi:arsenite oxidase small subunit